MDGAEWAGMVGPEHEPESAASAASNTPLDISRLHTVRLVSPEVAGGISDQRARLAREHLSQAKHLRQMADSVLDRFEGSSHAVQYDLDEWMYLQTLPARTSDQQERLAVLTGEMREMERVLSHQWNAVADMLREAANHEVSAQLLLSRMYQG